MNNCTTKKAAPVLADYFLSRVVQHQPTPTPTTSATSTSQQQEVPHDPQHHHHHHHVFPQPRSHVHDSVVVTNNQKEEEGEEVWPPVWAAQVQDALQHDDALRRSLHATTGTVPVPVPLAAGVSNDTHFAIEPLFGGNTNKVYRVQVPCVASTDFVSSPPTPQEDTAEERKEDVTLTPLLVREYATGVEAFIDRRHEVLVAGTMASAGVSPVLYRCYDWGRVEEFLDGHRNATLEDFLEQPIKKANSSSTVGVVGIAEATMKNFARIHAIPLQDVQSETKFAHWTGNTLHAHLQHLRDYNKGKGASFSSSSSSSLDALVRYFEGEAADVVRAVEASGGPLVFSHNDLNMGNIMAHRQELAVVKFIDFEYSAVNHRCFDIGNHLAEWNYDYDARHENGFAARYSTTHCPRLLKEADAVLTAEASDDAEEERRRRDVIHSCLSHYAAALAAQSGDADFDAVLSEIVRESFVGMMASHLVWTLWSLTMAIQTAPDDPCRAAGSSGLFYVAVAQKRLNDYCDVKSFCRENGLA